MLQAFPEMPGFSSIAQEFRENDIYLAMFKFWEMKWHKISKNCYKTKLGYP
jgi:hypothetical protein